jgi:hypothetical protein
LGGGFRGTNSGFAHFEDGGLFLDMVSIAHKEQPLGLRFVFSKNIIKHNLILISLSYLLSGGGDYRGIYDIGFKRGFMGYRGLLLNAP